MDKCDVCRAKPAYFYKNLGNRFLCDKCYWIEIMKYIGGIALILIIVFTVINLKSSTPKVESKSLFNSFIEAAKK